MKLRHRSAADRSELGGALPDPRIAEVRREHAEQDRLHAALLDTVATTVPAALLLARTTAWDEGWEAARRGLPKTCNPVRPAL
jgi:hypothetical protein